MNRTYKVIWNHSLQEWTATSELGKARKKESRSISNILITAGLGAALFGSMAIADPAFIGFENPNSEWKEIPDGEHEVTDNKTTEAWKGTGKENANIKLNNSFKFIGDRDRKISGIKDLKLTIEENLNINENSPTEDNKLDEFWIDNSTIEISNRQSLNFNQSNNIITSSNITSNLESNIQFNGEESYWDSSSTLTIKGNSTSAGPSRLNLDKAATVNFHGNIIINPYLEVVVSTGDEIAKYAQDIATVEGNSTLVLNDVSINHINDTGITDEDVDTKSNAIIMKEGDNTLKTLGSNLSDTSVNTRQSNRDSHNTIILGNNSKIDNILARDDRGAVTLELQSDSEDEWATDRFNKIQRLDELRLSGNESISHKYDNGTFSTTSTYAEQTYHLGDTAYDALNSSEINRDHLTHLTIDNNATLVDDLVSKDGKDWTSLADGTSGADLILDLGTGDSKAGVADGTKAGTYVLKDENDYAFNNTLKGEGEYRVELDQKEFSFNPDANTEDFSGTLNIANGTIDLTDEAIGKINGSGTATFKLSDDGQNSYGTAKFNTEAGNEGNTLNHLEFAGGRLALEGAKNHVDENIENSGVKPLEVGQLTVSDGSSTIEVSDGIVFSQDKLEEYTDIDKHKNFLDQQNRTDVQLVKTTEDNKVSSTGGSIQLVRKDDQGNDVNIGGGFVILDDSGNPIAESGKNHDYNSDTSLSITDPNDSSVSLGDANYGFIGVVDKDGIHIGYGLQELAADDGKQITVTNAGADNNTLSAKLTNKNKDPNADGGGFIFDVDASSNTGELHIANSDNDYTGKTNVTGDGTLIFDADNAFGKSKEIIIGNGASNKEITVDMGESTQIVEGTIEVEGSGILNINKGKLDIDSTEEQKIDGQLVGTDQATINLIDEGDLSIAQNNQGFGGTVNVGNKAEVNLAQAGGLGGGKISFDDLADPTDPTNRADITIENADSGIFSNVLEGEGNINFDGSGIVNLESDNSNFTGNFNVSQGSSIIHYSDNPSGLGEANINNDGEFTFQVNQGEASLWDVASDNSIKGDGTFIKEGAGTFILENPDQYQQAITELKDGTTIAGFDPDDSNKKNEIFKFDTDQLRIDTGAVFVANGKVEIGQFDDSGNLIDDTGSVINYGSIYLGGAYGYAMNQPIDPNNPQANQDEKNKASNKIGELTIHGDYTGHKNIAIGNDTINSKIYFGGDLADDGSPIDRLIIKGDLIGTGTIVDIQNIQGMGDITKNGIDFITVEGNGQAGFFTLDNDNTVEGGAYLYEMKERNDGKGWYLETQKTNPNFPGGGGPGTDIIGPHASAYLANLAANNQLFNIQLHDRNYFDSNERVWGRMDGHFGKSKDSAKQSSIKTDSFVMQMGFDLYKQQSEDTPLTFGIMGGYGHTKSRVTNNYVNNANNRKATGKGDGWSIGGYATYGDAENFYVDSWLQYAHFSNRVEADYLNQDEKYKSKGVLASVEVGNTVAATDGLYIQPQGQLTWAGVKQDTHHARDGSKIHGNKDNIQLRLGARFSGDYNPDGINPYGELNYFHNTRSYTMNFDGNINSPQLRQRGARNQGQIKAGINGHLDQDISAWGEISHKVGSNSYQDTKISVGLKYEY